MQAYHLAHFVGSEGSEMVLAAKNVAGHRSKGVRQANPIIWNNCGQIVIPGGGIGATENPVRGAQREFFEETGVDLRIAAVRQAMRCAGDPVPRRLRDQDGLEFWCVYQRIELDSPLVAAINANINGNRPADDELHDAATAPVIHSMDFFGPRRFDDGWRFQQFEALPPPYSGQALEHMYDPYNWFVIAANNIPRLEE